MSGVEVVETASFWSLSCPYNPSPGPLVFPALQPHRGLFSGIPVSVPFPSPPGFAARAFLP